MLSPTATVLQFFLIPLAVLIIYYDVRYRRIPNAFVLATLISGLTLNIAMDGLNGGLNSLDARITEKPVLTISALPEGAAYIACSEGAAAASAGATHYDSGTVVNVCAQADRSHSITGVGCGGAAWTAVDETESYSCSVTLSSNTTVSVDVADLATNTVSIISTAEQGSLKCYVAEVAVDDLAGFACSAASAVNECGASYVLHQYDNKNDADTKEVLCVFGDVSDAKFFDPGSSSCLGAEWALRKRFGLA